MIPILYNGTESEFLTNGIGRLTDCISCVVTEERNGIYECEFEYPVTGAHFADIKEGRIIAVTHDENGDVQPFDIYKRSAEIDGKVTFSARHISYRLGWTVVMPFTATSCSQALSRIPQYAHGGTPFTFWTDKAVSADYSLKAPEVIKGMLGGQEGSILDVFGTGEYEWDRFAVKLWLHRGEEKPVTIRYGKDMTDMTQDLDFGESYTSVIPIWVSPDGSSAVIGNQVNGGAALTDVGPWWYDGQRLPLMTDTDEELWFEAPVVRTTILNLSEQFPTRPTAKTLTNKAIETLRTNKPWIPTESIEVDFVRLYNSPEYERFAPLQQVGLCDTITVLYPELGVEASAKVVRVEYNVLLDRYDSMTIGDPETMFSDILHAQTIEEVARTAATKEYAMNAASSQANLLAGGSGGYVLIGRDTDGHPNEILIMNADNRETATDIIKIDRTGIAFSTNGYEGPYTTAWTINGMFSANFINAGRLASEDGSTYFDLDDNVIECADLSAGFAIRLRRSGISFISIDSSGSRTRVGSMNMSSNYHNPMLYSDNGSFLTLGYMPSGGDTIMPAAVISESVASLHDGVAMRVIGGIAFGTDATTAASNRGVLRYSHQRQAHGDSHYIRALYTSGIDCFFVENSNTSLHYGYAICAYNAYFTAGVSALGFESTSDERYKDVKPWDQRYDDLIDSLTPFLFRWHDHTRDDGRLHLGLGAQTVEKELKRLGIENSSLVKQDSSGEYSLNYVELSVLLMKKVQDQQKQIDAQQAKIDDLTARLEALERRLS